MGYSTTKLKNAPAWAGVFFNFSIYSAGVAGASGAGATIGASGAGSGVLAGSAGAGATGVVFISSVMFVFLI